MITIRGGDGEGACRKELLSPTFYHLMSFLIWARGCLVTLQYLHLNLTLDHNFGTQEWSTDQLIISGPILDP